MHFPDNFNNLKTYWLQIIKVKLKSYFHPLPIRFNFIATN